MAEEDIMKSFVNAAILQICLGVIILLVFVVLSIGLFIHHINPGFLPALLERLMELVGLI